MCLVLISTSIVVNVNASSLTIGIDDIVYRLEHDGQSRWNGELTVKMRLAVAAFALAQGVIFDDPATSNSILDFYNDLSDTDKRKVYALSELIDNVDVSYKTVANFKKDVADWMTGLISSFFTHEKYFSSSGSFDYGQSVSYNGNSNVDLTLADQIFLTTQTAADPSPNNHDCHVDYRISQGFVLRSYYHSYAMPVDIWTDYYNTTPNNCNYSILVPDGGDLCAFAYYSLSNNTVYSNLAFKFYDYQLTFKSVSNNSITFTFGGGNYCFVSKTLNTFSNTKYYRIWDYCGGYAFLDLNYSPYKNLIFDTQTDAVNYFLNQGGMSITEPFEVEESVSSTDVLEIDEDKQTQFITQISNMSDDDVITIVVPTTNTYNTFVSNPSLLFDFSQDNLYDSSINLPAADGNKWANKFPFCIPFDVYYLFSNFSAEPEAPTFHLVVIPANSFGMNNDEFALDIDFAPYNALVQIMRFFMAAGFVLWLMSKTKDLMQ